MLKKIKDKFQEFLPEKWPSLRQCRSFFLILNEKEKSTFQIAATTFFVSLAVLISVVYFQNTRVAPAFGGRYVEGMVGRPQLLNPIYSVANDVDRDIASILFSEIVSHELPLQVIPDLAEKITSKGNIVEVELREGLKWSDGKEMTADDIVFTIEAIQNPKTRSPFYPNWIGVRIEKASELVVRFYLEEESSVFLNRLSFRPIPKHVWEGVGHEGFAFSEYNLDPVGSGPYRIKNLNNGKEGKIESITLEVNPYYHGKKPNIEEIVFVFFNNTDEMLEAAKRGRIQGLATINPETRKLMAKEARFQETSFYIPRLFALFLNLEGNLGLLKDKEFRRALSYGTDRESLLQKVLYSGGEVVVSALLPEIYGLEAENPQKFDPEKANNILDNLGLRKNENGIREKTLAEKRDFQFKENLNVGSQGDEVRELQRCLIEKGFYEGEVTGFYGTETKSAVIDFQEAFREEILAPGGFTKGTGMVAVSTRAKLNEVCSSFPEIKDEVSVSISTVNQPLMVETAGEIKEQWGKLGINVEVLLFDLTSLESDIIKKREYQILLFGKALDPIPDYFPFWHSSQKSEYGLNLSMYAESKVDSLLESIRKETEKEKREGMLRELDAALAEDVPAILLFNPEYTLFTSPDIKGIRSGIVPGPSQRFENIEDWFIKTRRVRK